MKPINPIKPIPIEETFTIITNSCFVGFLVILKTLIDSFMNDFILVNIEKLFKYEVFKGFYLINSIPNSDSIFS